MGYPSNDLKWLRQRIIDLHGNGRQIAVHCNGDAAIDAALDAYEEAQHQFPRDDARFIVIHSQMARPDQIERMSRLGRYRHSSLPIPTSGGIGITPSLWGRSAPYA